MRFTRRKVLGLAAAAATTPLLPRTAWPQAAGATVSAAGHFFTKPEMALLDELTELILPTDEHSPGARAAQVAGYIDGRLGEYDPEIKELREEQEQWKAGLGLVDAVAREATGTTFLEATVAERLAVLEKLAANEKDPKTPAEEFFALLKEWTVKGYYTSRIGIHDELEYKGNGMLPEFVGTDVAALPPPAKGSGRG